MKGQIIVQFTFPFPRHSINLCPVILVPNDTVPITQRVTRLTLVVELVVLQSLVQAVQALEALGLMVTVLEQPTSLQDQRKLPSELQTLVHVLPQRLS